MNEQERKDFKTSSKLAKNEIAIEQVAHTEQVKLDQVLIYQFISHYTYNVTNYRTNEVYAENLVAEELLDYIDEINKLSRESSEC